VYTTLQDALDRGWVDGLSDALCAKIDEAYNTPQRKGLAGAQLAAYVREFLGTLDADTNKKFGAFISDMLNPTAAPGKWGWSDLYRLYKVRDQQFANEAAWAAASGISMHPHSPTGADARTMVRGFKYTDTLTCLDVATGKAIWKKEFEAGHDNSGLNSGYGASCTPTIAGGNCYFTGGSGVYCLSAKDGTLIWRVKAPFSNSSPLVQDGVAYVCLSDGLAAYDAAKGTVIWTQPEAKSSTTTFVPWSSGGKKLLIGMCPSQVRNGDMACVDAATGALLWKLPIPVRCHGSPAICDDLAVISGVAVRLTPQKGEVAWKGDFASECSSMLIHQGYVYAVGGSDKSFGVHCYELKTGALKWEQKMRVEQSSPLLVDGKIIVNMRPGTDKKDETEGTVMFRATPEKYDELGRNVYPAKTVLNDLASPVVAGQRLYLRLFDRIACYDLPR